MKLTHIRLLVSDFDSCFRFYRDVMGFTPTWGAEGEGYADFRAGADDFSLALFDRREMAEAVGNTGLSEEAQDRVALIFHSDDLDSAAEELRARGVTFLVEPTPRPDWGIIVAHFRDPDGNLIEINSPIPTAEWTDELREEAENHSA